MNNEINKIHSVSTRTKYIILFAIVLITVFESCGQLCFKEFQKQNLFLYFLLGIFFYFAVCCLLVLCYRHNGFLGEVNLTWSCMSIVLVIIVGHTILGEYISYNDIIAVGLAIGAIYFANK